MQLALNVFADALGEDHRKRHLAANELDCFDKAVRSEVKVTTKIIVSKNPIHGVS